MSSTEIPASLVKQLREETGAGMMDCKRALTEAEGDLETARRLLREQGMAAAIKRQVRQTTEGKVVYRLEGDRAALVAIGCETEPVSGNEEFLAFAKRVLDLVDEEGPDAVESLEQERQDLVAKLGENVVVRGAARYEVEPEGERLAAYAHPPANKIGVLLKARGGTDELARQLAMHISFAAPRWTSRSEVTEDYVGGERAIYEKLPEVLSKPEQAREKIVQGMLNKRFYAASPGGVLEEQQWIHDTSKTVAQALAEGGLELAGFVRFSVAE
jgi:elongation factor Ts